MQQASEEGFLPLRRARAHLARQDAIDKDVPQAHHVVVILWTAGLEPHLIVVLVSDQNRLRNDVLPEHQALSEQPFLVGRRGEQSPTAVVGKCALTQLGVALRVAPAKFGGQDTAHVIVQHQAVLNGSYHRQSAQAGESRRIRRLLCDRRQRPLVEAPHQRSDLQQLLHTWILGFVQALH